MTPTDAKSLASELRGELVTLKSREQAAIAAGQKAQATELRAQIGRVESRLAALTDRVAEIEGRQQTAGSYRFTVRRDPFGLIDEVVARPIDN